MICPVCGKEISKPLHISKSKDDAHKEYVESQKELAASLLLSGMSLAEIQKDERILMTSTITDYLYENFKEQLLSIGRKKRNEKISKSNYRGGGLRGEQKQKLSSILENGVEDEDYVVCQICDLRSTNISSHVYRIHNLKAVEYKALYPGKELFSRKLREGFRDKISKNNPNNNPSSIEKMRQTKAITKEERIKKAKKQFANGERTVSNNIGRGIGGFRNDLGHYCRSTWEANVARILKLKKIDYCFEMENFSFCNDNGDVLINYLPDFYLPKFDTYIEVKGQMDDLSKDKIKLFKSLNKKLIIVDSKKYDKLFKRYGKFIDKKWENGKRNIRTHPELFKSKEME